LLIGDEVDDHEIENLRRLVDKKQRLYKGIAYKDRKERNDINNRKFKSRAASMMGVAQKLAPLEEQFLSNMR
jgi:hypothetical protein